MPRKHDHFHAHDSGAHAHKHDAPEGDPKGHHHGAPFGRKVVEVPDADNEPDLTLLLKRSIEQVEAKRRDEDD